MRLVEVVAPGSASEDVVARATATMRAWGKTPVRSADAPGFIVNRVNRPFTIEALRLVEGAEATVSEIDEAIRAAGFPMGPFELMDLVGIDVNLAAAQGVWEGLGRADVWRRQINAAHRPPSGFAGTPTTVTPGSTERVTHAPAPTTASSPMTSGRSSVPLMIEAPLPM